MLKKRLFQFLVWNCLKSIFGQIPEIYKNTKRYNCRYSGDGTSYVKPVFSPDSRCSHDAMRCHPQHSTGNHPYTGEIRIDQIRKKSQNCNAGNNPQRHLYKADKNIQTKPFPFFLPCFQNWSEQEENHGKKKKCYSQATVKSHIIFLQ